MTDSLSLPGDIDPNERHVEFHAEQCRACSEMGPWVNWADRMTDSNVTWGHKHMAETGHGGKFYVFTLTRNTAENMTLKF